MHQNKNKCLGLSSGVTLLQFLEALISEGCYVSVYLETGICLSGVIRSASEDGFFLSAKNDQFVRSAKVTTINLQDGWTAFPRVVSHGGRRLVDLSEG